MSLFKTDTFGFYLQDAFVKDWIENTMVFLEVDNVARYWNELSSLGLPEQYENVRLVPFQTLDWAKKFFVHDPSEILWHVEEFY